MTHDERLKNQLNKERQEVAEGIVLKSAYFGLDFFLTFGWSILLILLSILALWYFGILSADVLLPEHNVSVFP